MCYLHHGNRSSCSLVQWMPWLLCVRIPHQSSGLDVVPSDLIGRKQGGGSVAVYPMVWWFIVYIVHLIIHVLWMDLTSSRLLLIVIGAGGGGIYEHGLVIVEPQRLESCVNFSPLHLMVIFTYLLK